MLDGLFETGKFEFQEMLDDVLAKRLNGVQFAFAQIFDLLRDQQTVQAIADRRQAAQQFRLFLRPGVEIVVVARSVGGSHACELITYLSNPDTP